MAEYPKTVSNSGGVTLATDDTLVGPVTETAPASDTASSGLNGRLQRIAQRLTTIGAGTPAALGQTTAANSEPVVLATDGAVTGGVTEAAPASDTASSGLNGRLQRIAQRLTSLIAQHPSALGTGGGMMTEGNLAIDAVSTSNPLMSGGRASTAIPSAVSADGDVQANWLTRTGAQVVDGGIAGAATDAGNPVKIGGLVSTATPTTMATGKRADLWVGNYGQAMIGVVGAAGADVYTNVASGQIPSSAGVLTQLDVRPMLFNGTTWDRPRGNNDGTALASAARTITTASADIVNYNGRGLDVILDMTAVGTGSVTMTIQGKDVLSGQYYTILAGAAVVTNSTNIYRVYPGLTAAANAVANFILPRTWRVNVVVNNANSATYSVGYSLVV